MFTDMVYLIDFGTKRFSIVRITYLMNLEEVLILKHVSNTSADGSFLPCFEGILSVLDGSIELLASGLRDLANKLLCGLYFRF
jgi:hypothetical protein